MNNKEIYTTDKRVDIIAKFPYEGKQISIKSYEFDNLVRLKEVLLNTVLLQDLKDLTTLQIKKSDFFSSFRRIRQIKIQALF